MIRPLRSLAALVLLGVSLAGVSLEARGEDAFARATALMERKDFATAIPLLRQLAEENNGDAQAFLAGLYLVGIGLQQDVQLARQWFERAVRNGNATAAYNLGMMRERGEDGPADLTAAALWYEKGAQGDFPLAMLKLGEAYRSGRGVDPDPAKASHWLRAAADAGLPDAQNLMGVMIAEGEAEGSPVEAYAWFKLAADNGQPEAEGNMEVLRPQLSTAEVADAERRALAGHPARDR